MGGRINLMKLPMTRLTAIVPFIALLAAPSPPPGVLPLGGPQLVITVNFADRIRPAGGAYYVAFNADDSILLGPQPDSTNWQHYVVLRGGRFFFGTVPAAPYRPFGFETIRPPEPYPYGQILPEGRTVRIQVSVSALQTGTVPPRQVKINIVTIDDFLRPIDALGRGADDRFGFVTLNLLRDTYVAFTDPARDAREPAFDITGGDVQVITP